MLVKRAKPWRRVSLLGFLCYIGNLPMFTDLFVELLILVFCLDIVCWYQMVVISTLLGAHWRMTENVAIVTPGHCLYFHVCKECFSVSVEHFRRAALLIWRQWVVVFASWCVLLHNRRALVLLASTWLQNTLPDLLTTVVWIVRSTKE